MLKLKSLTLKNFLSIGNVTQSINFTDADLVLVLGENLDLGGNDNRNGVGKSSIVNALSYALYGAALTNIKKDNLINATNMKHMLVTLTFEVDGIDYKIERGRKPGIFKFIKNGVEKDTNDDESQGEGRHTQLEIERTIGVSHNMFKHILALNTYVEPFLALRANDQRELIEQLLGITKLSEKAEKLKEELRITRDQIKEEEFRISAATESNKRIEQNINSLITKSSDWGKSKSTKIGKLQASILEMLSVEIDEEIQLHKSSKIASDLNTEHQSLNKDLLSLNNDISQLRKSILRVDNKLASLKEKICPTCNQEMDKDTHNTVHNEYIEQKQELTEKLHEKSRKYSETKALAESTAALIPALPDTYYPTVEEAYNHKTMLDTLGNSLSAELETENPFTDQIELLRNNGLQEIDFSKLNESVKLKEHQEFLTKLLTNKDSFIRKKIIDQNLTLLNHRLAHYLIEIGLPHAVVFKSDLEVEISMYGKEFDFDNLSRGERTRLILSLSWAFRDVFESMNDKINLMFIDELCDTGLDLAGADSVLKTLKEIGRAGSKNIFLISHKDEFVSRIPNILKVIKEGGFTSIEVADPD